MFIFPGVSLHSCPTHVTSVSTVCQTKLDFDSPGDVWMSPECLIRSNNALSNIDIFSTKSMEHKNFNWQQFCIKPELGVRGTFTALFVVWNCGQQCVKTLQRIVLMCPFAHVNWRIVIVCSADWKELTVRNIYDKSCRPERLVTFQTLHCVITLHF